MRVEPRQLLQGMGLLTVVALLGKVVSLAAPMPIAEAPAALGLPGYAIRGLEEGAQPRQGRALSHGSQRMFRLEPRSGDPPLTLRLMPVRSRRGSEVSEETDVLHGLNMEAVGALVPSFALLDRRILTLGPLKPEGPKPLGDQLALGRAPDDPPGSITRLQTCLSPTGVAGLHSTILVPENQKLERAEDPSWSRHLRRMVGLSEPRYECLAVQLERENGGGGVVDHRAALQRAWKDLRGALVKPPAPAPHTAPRER